MLIDIPTGEIVAMLSRLQAIQEQLKEKSESDDEFIETHRPDLEHWANSFGFLCGRLQINIERSAAQLRRKMLDPQAILIPLWVIWRDFRRDIVQGIVAHTFYYIPEELSQYQNREALFGENVFEKFPAARSDVKLAGNCLAAGLNTACVFHLMRVVEHGLRKIARQLRVPFPATYDLKTWEQLLKLVESEIGKIVAQPKTPARLKRLKFYNPIPLEFRFFKDAWRNHVMHCRAEYDEHEAKTIMLHVENLMKHIAKGK